MSLVRINVIPPYELSTRDLHMEYHELPRIFEWVRKAQRKGRLPKEIVPPAYVIGKRHASFFYDKLGFLNLRHQALIVQLRQRTVPLGSTLELRKVNQDLSEIWWGDYIPTEAAMTLNRQAVTDRRLRRRWSVIYQP